MNREDFAMLNSDLIYFDNAASSLKPKCVVNYISDFYNNHYSNIHRGDYDIAVYNEKLYNNVRVKVKDLIHADRSSEIVFTSGTTDSMNMIVFGFMKNYLKAGDEVLITKSEHASNILPWLELAKEININIKYIPLNTDYSVTIDNVNKSITANTKVISLAHITNVIGDVRDIDTIGKICKDKNILFVVDAAQSLGHTKVNVSNIDFLAGSAHKMLGPTGIGVLYGKYKYLNELKPVNYGGGMNASFNGNGEYELKDLPERLEAGTPNVGGVLGFGRAIDYLNEIGLDKIEKYELELKKYLVDKISSIKNVKVYNKNSKSGILTFNIDGVFSQDAAIYLNYYKICVRAGNHCAKILKDEINEKNTCRVSLYFYNNKEEIDKFIDALKNSKDIFKVVI